MSTIGGLLGTAGGQAGTGFNTQSGTSMEQLGQAQQGSLNSMQGQQNLLGALQAQNGLGNQSQVYNQFQNIANGQGPNPAQAMLNQETSKNVANQAALMAGQRGAGANVGLMARQAGQQGMQAQQQAAGQGASMQAEQALNAIGQAGGMANNMAANQIGQTNANTAAAQNQQNMLLGSHNANNAVQGQLTNTALGGAQKFQSGMINSGAQAAMMADGGTVPSGSAFGPQSMFAQAVLNPQNTQVGNFMSAPDMDPAMKRGPKKDPMATQNANIGAEAAQALQGSSNAVPGGSMSAGDVPMMPVAAHGGNIGSKLKQGGHVPGKAKVAGNSYKNDTVKALLSPGEVVIPKSVMESGDPINGAAAFVRSVMAKKGRKA